MNISKVNGVNIVQAKSIIDGVETLGDYHNLFIKTPETESFWVGTLNVVDCEQGFTYEVWWNSEFKLKNFPKMYSEELRSEIRKAVFIQIRREFGEKVVIVDRYHKDEE